jgi:acetyl-CoA C-acetyltransferase
MFGRKAVILSVARTPVGAIGGALSGLTSIQLGSIAGKAAIDRAGITPAQIQEVLFSNVCSANLGQAPHTQVARGVGCDWSVPGTTVNKVCASGTKATMIAAQSVQLGLQDCVLVVGAESMSNVPYYVPKGRYGYNYGHGEFLDGVLRDGLLDSFSREHMVKILKAIWRLIAFLNSGNVC